MNKLAIGLFLFSCATGAAPDAGATIPMTITRNGQPITKNKEPKNTIDDDPSENRRRHITWGIEAGSSIDLGSHDMSTFDVEISAGYTNDFIRTAGVGLGIQRGFGTGDTFIPVYALFQSSFRSKPSLLFFSLKVGYSFSALGDSPMYGDTSAMAGLGFNLAMKRNFRSHIILGFGYRHYNTKHKEAFNLDTSNVGLAHLSFGIGF